MRNNDIYELHSMKKNYTAGVIFESDPIILNDVGDYEYPFILHS